MASKSLQDGNRATIISPERAEGTARGYNETRPLREALLIQQYPSRTPPWDAAFERHSPRTYPPPARPGAKERIWKMEREALAQSYWQSYAFDIRAGLIEGILATVSGTLKLEMIDATEDNDELAKCKLVIEDMIWDTGSHGCTITTDLLPERYTKLTCRPWK